MQTLFSQSIVAIPTRSQWADVTPFQPASPDCEAIPSQAISRGASKRGERWWAHTLTRPRVTIRFSQLITCPAMVSQTFKQALRNQPNRLSSQGTSTFQCSRAKISHASNHFQVFCCNQGKKEFPCVKATGLRMISSRLPTTSTASSMRSSWHR